MKLKQLFIPLLASVLLFGCSDQTSSTSGQSSLSESTSISTPISSDSSISSSKTPRSSSSKISHLSTDEISSGSSGGSLVEIGAERILAVGDVYTCTFVPSDFLNKDIYIQSTVDGIIKVEQKKEGSNTFTITPLKVGETLLKIYTVDQDCLVYRNVVRVGQTYDSSKITDVMYDKVDIWKSTGIYGTYKMTFVTETPLTGTISGFDDYESTYVQFGLKYLGVEKLYDFSFHRYTITVDADNSSTQKSFTDMYVSVTGDNILVYYDEGLLDMFIAMN